MEIPMKVRVAALLLASSLVNAAVQAQEAPAGSPSSQILGVWRAEADGLPAVTLTVTDEGGSLSGAILFYFHQRKSVNDPYTSTPGLPEPIFHPAFDGQTLTFQVSHRRAHPPRTLSDPPVTLTLRITGRDSTGHIQGELTNVTEHSPSYPITKSDH
jgi:hypothetical protein